VEWREPRVGGLSAVYVQVSAPARLLPEKRPTREERNNGTEGNTGTQDSQSHGQQEMKGLSIQP